MGRLPGAVLVHGDTRDLSGPLGLASNYSLTNVFRRRPGGGDLRPILTCCVLRKGASAHGHPRGTVTSHPSRSLGASKFSCA